MPPVLRCDFCGQPINPDQGGWVRSEWGVQHVRSEVCLGMLVRAAHALSARFSIIMAGLAAGLAAAERNGDGGHPNRQTRGGLPW